MRRTEPAQRRGKSDQAVQTPANFFDAVVELFGPMVFDLAATAENARCEHFFTLADDALAQDWTKLRGNLWLNPPFDPIDPWASKCAAAAPYGQGDRRIFLLVPASVGANWFIDHVYGKALILALAPRLRFVGHSTPYPKDCLLCAFGEPPGFDVWRWGRTDRVRRSTGRAHRVS